MYEMRARASERNIVLCNSTDYVYYYDDLIVQLDTYLLEFTSDPAISMIYFAYRTLETKYAHDLLRARAEGRDMDSAIAKMKQISEQYKASRFKFQKWGEKSYVTV